ncbi:MAG: hypothetical protein HIU83_14260 [Proteobacteria bacterium]|nr:hypothetical protein [Pseudomonadota bacterium]
MKTNKTRDTSDSFLRENHFYPRHESDRADELVDELDEGQILRLYNELKTKTLTEWLNWLDTERGSICQYDALSRAKRRQQLKKKGEPGLDAVRLQHACIFVELWRWRIHREFFPLPPNAPPIDTHQKQRDLMLNVMAAYYRYDDRDLWPFLDHPDIDDRFPFRKET